jgi:hypothetical protein
MGPKKINETLENVSKNKLRKKLRSLIFEMEATLLASST